jgi:hypothetical protein
MKNNKKLFKIIFTSIVVLLTALVVYKNKQRVELLNGDDVSYVVGKIISFEQGASVNPWFDYEFYVEEKKYEGKYNIIDGMDKERVRYYKSYVGKYFYVKYSKTKPKFNEMNIYNPVPDSIVKKHFYFGNISK